MLNRLITSKSCNQSAIRIFQQQNKSIEPGDFISEFYQIFKKELIHSQTFKDR